MSEMTLRHIIKVICEVKELILNVKKLSRLIMNNGFI